MIMIMLTMNFRTYFEHCQVYTWTMIQQTKLVPGGGGGALRYRGGPHLRYVFRGRRGLFLRPHTKYGGQNPLTIHEIYAALTPSDFRSDSGLLSLLPPLAAAKQAEDYKISS